MYSPSRVISSPSGTEPLPSPSLAPIAENEDVSLGRDSEEFHHAQRIVPPDDSIEDVRAMPAEAILEESPSPPDVSPRRLTFPPASFYQRKGGCSRCSLWLALLFVIFLMLSIALFIVWAVTSDGFRNLGKQPHVCSSKGCIHTAFRMSSYMDDSILPCDNFYRYSCGRFHQLAIDKRRNFLEEQRENTARTVHGMLSANPEIGVRSERLAKTLFSSCMDIPARAKTGGYPLLYTLRNLPCGPILSDCQDFRPESYNWERHNGMLDWYGGNFLFVVYGKDVNPSDRTHLILQLRPPNLQPLLEPLRQELIRLARPSPNEVDALLQLTIRQNLLNDMVSRQLMRDPKEVEDQLDEVALLFVEMDRITRTIAPANVSYLRIGELINTVPQINFTEMFNAQLSSIYHWTPDDVVAIEDLDYLLRLSQTISNTPKRAIANYLLAVTALNLRDFTYNPKVSVSPEIEKEISWRECVNSLTNLVAVEKMYIAIHDKLPLKKIRKFLETSKTDFLSNHRQYVPQSLAEVNRLGFLVGYPEWKTNEDRVWRPYSDTVLNQSDYFMSATSSFKAQRNSELSQLGGRLERDDAPVFPVISQAIIYEPRLGNLVYPLSFLQEPIVFPGDQVPWNVVYGTLGVVTQQMISKIFWSKADQRNPQECLEDTFRSFLNSDIRNNVNIGKDLEYTIQMADGLRTALSGYQKWQTDNHQFDEKSLPAYESLDNMQTMLLAYGTMFCNTEADQPGSEYEAMINSAVSNAKLFSMHFQCTNSSAIFNRRLCL